MNIGSQIRSDPYDNLSGLLDLWNAVRRHLPSILLFIFLSLIITWLVVSKIDPVYRASASISIEKESAGSNSSAAMREFRSTQVEILRSRSLIENVVKTLDLSSHKAFNSRGPGWQQLLVYWRDKYLGNTEATVYEEQYAVDDENDDENVEDVISSVANCLLYTSPSPRD